MPGAGGAVPSDRARRLFVAVEVSPTVREAVEAAVAAWRGALPSARWVPPENWHVTVRFIGSVPGALVGWVEAAVAEAAAGLAPFELSLDAIGAFPSPRRAKVLWAGLDDRSGRARELARAMDAALAEKLPTTARAFHPHLTVARCDPPLSLPGPFASTPVAPAQMRVDRVVLFESVAGGPSVRYDPLGTFSLRG
jgi:RNA 2',3'-cyclic 3'-phosphodiesterase